MNIHKDGGKDQVQFTKDLTAALRRARWAKLSPANMGPDLIELAIKTTVVVIVLSLLGIV